MTKSALWLIIALEGAGLTYFSVALAVALVWTLLWGGAAWWNALAVRGWVD